MVNELALKGNELLIYAIIYGFSQDDQRFSGSLQYLADWLNSSKQCVINNLKSLCTKGLLEKFEYEKNGLKFCEYQANYLNGSQKSLPPQSKKLTGGSQKSLPNNIEDNIEDIIGNNIEIEEPDGSPTRHKYGEYQNVLLSDRDLEKLKAEFPDWENRIERLSEYIASTGKQYKNHLATIRTWARSDAKKRQENAGGNIFMEIAREEGIL